MSDDAKKIILARRARFIAAAVASFGVGAAAASCKPCLDIAGPEPDGGEYDAGDAGDAGDADEPEGGMAAGETPRRSPS